MRYLQNIPVPLDMYISTTSYAKKRSIEDVFSNWTLGSVDIRVTANRGRDVGPTLVAFERVYDEYDVILHLHSKKSPHSDDLSSWRHFLFETLVGSPSIVTSVLDAFEKNKNLGMVCAPNPPALKEWISWASNWERANDLATRMGFKIDPNAKLDFPAGSMFWARSAALRPLLELGLTEEDFEVEQSQSDGTLAHAIERLFFYTCERAGFTWARISRPDILSDSSTAVEITTSADVDRYLQAHNQGLLSRP